MLRYTEHCFKIRRFGYEEPAVGTQGFDQETLGDLRQRFGRKRTDHQHHNAPAGNYRGEDVGSMLFLFEHQVRGCHHKHIVLDLQLGGHEFCEFWGLGPRYDFDYKLFFISIGF